MYMKPDVTAVRVYGMSSGKVAKAVWTCELQPSWYQSLEDGDIDFHYATKEGQQQKNATNGGWQHRHQGCRRKQGLVLGTTMRGTMQSHMGTTFGANASQLLCICLPRLPADVRHISQCLWLMLLVSANAVLEQWQLRCVYDMAWHHGAVTNLPMCIEL